MAGKLQVAKPERVLAHEPQVCQTGGEEEGV